MNFENDLYTLIFFSLCAKVTEGAVRCFIRTINEAIFALQNGFNPLVPGAH